MNNGLNIVAVQANPHVGNFNKNFNYVKEMIEKYKDHDVIVFPESFLVGYPLDDLVLNNGFLAESSNFIYDLTKFVVEVGGPAIVIGAPDSGENLPYNAAFFISPDGSKKVIHKHNLPNDGPFDEKRTFSSGNGKRSPIFYKGYNLGIIICEEMWHGEVASYLSSELADLFIVINGSPYTRNKHYTTRIPHAKKRVMETGVPLLYLNMVGGQDELVFDGGSFLVDAKKNVVKQAPFFVNAEIVININKSNGETEIVNSSIVSSIENYEVKPSNNYLDYCASVVGLRDYVYKNGFKKVILGISGGADSTLVAAMAVDAFGVENVLGTTLPSHITNDINDAYLVSEALGIKMEEINIAKIYNSFVEALAPLFEGTDKDVTEENLQSRSRMMINMAISNKFGCMLLTTGNKSETSVGYCTLYGDMGGGFNPIKDLYKTEVWELMRYRNSKKPEGWMLGKNKDCMPEHIITKVPTAGLSVGQTDEEKLGPYHVLDTYLRLLVDTQISSEEALRTLKVDTTLNWPKEIKEKYLTIEYVRFISRLVYLAEYKRRQAAPGIKIGNRAFGRDRRFPISNAYKN